MWGDEHEIVSFVEPNKQCRMVLARNWIGVSIEYYIEEFVKKNWWLSNVPIGIVSGGDPCPIRSKARSIWGTKHPDLSGYFLAVVAKCRPEWVLRENVPASDDIDFYTTLEVLGYRSVIINTNAKTFTGQSRPRDIIVGCSRGWKMQRFRAIYQRHGSSRVDKKKSKNMPKSLHPCLTTHPARYDSRDGYIWDGSGKIRTANQGERERLSGFPVGWLDGLSKTAVCRATGNAVVPQIVVPIMEAIKEVLICQLPDKEAVAR